MAAVPPVTMTMPPPTAGGSPGPTQASPSGSIAAPQAPQASPSEAAQVILAQPEGPTEAQIQAELAQLLQQLDNQPAEHPTAPSVVILEGKESALREALTQVSLAPPGIEQIALSGAVLNAAV